MYPDPEDRNLSSVLADISALVSRSKTRVRPKNKDKIGVSAGVVSKRSEGVEVGAGG
jgi:hypothetical protein